MSNPIPAVHPTAIVNGELTLGEGASVGAYCVIDGRVTLGAGTRVLSHTVVGGTTVVGANCRLGPHAAIGTDPQHAGYAGAETCLVIGDDVVVREFASVHKAYKPGVEHATRVGDGCFVMTGAHVGHDCVLDERVTLASAVQLGGHVTVGARAFIGGGTVVHQFVRFGRLAIVTGDEAVVKDVPPFGAMVARRLKAYNAVGCRRAGMAPAVTRAVRAAYVRIHAAGSPPQAAAALRAEPGFGSVAEVRELVEFIETTKRGITPSGRGRGGADED